MSAARSMLLGLTVAAFAGGMAMAQTAPADQQPSTSALLAAADSSQAKPTMAEGVAAIVNDEIITTYDLRQRVLLMLVTNGIQPTPENLREVEREAAQALINERLEMQEIHSIESRQKDLHLQLTAKELDEHIDDLAQSFNVKRTQLLSTLASAGVDRKTLNDQIGTQQAWFNYIGGRYHGTVRVGDDQVNQEQARINASAAKAQYQVSEILIDAAHAGSAQAALDGANQLSAQIKHGAPFAAVARQFSALPTAGNGGDAGWLNAGDLNPALEAALVNMRPGQVSDPIVVGDGVYLIQLRDKHAGSGATLVTLKQAAVRVPTDASAEQISIAQAKLIKLKAEVRNCQELEPDAGKFDGVVAGDLGETEVTELSPEFKQVVDGLKVGQVGGPVRTKAGLHLIALCGQRASGKNSLTREEIANRLENEQLTMISKRYLRDLRNSATIESR